MGKEIRFLLVFLIAALAVLVYLQNKNPNPIPNSGSLDIQNTQHFTSDGQTLSKKDNVNDKNSSSKDSQKVSSRIINNIIKNERNENNSNQAQYELDSMLDNNSYDNNTGHAMMQNPVFLNIDKERNTIPDSDQDALDELIREVETGNSLQINSPQDQLFKQRSTSINSAKNGFRKVNYADSSYRMNFNGENDSNVSEQSQEELDTMYNDALIFKNTEHTNNNKFTGMPDSNGQWANANLQEFTTTSPQTQQDKILNLYNSNNYLPNNNLLKPDLTKGFQILDNPVAVDNPSLIPVLKAIPVSSVLGSKRNSTWDIRAEPPNPRTVVSPFLNSSIQPDIYATQRGCL